MPLRTYLITLDDTRGTFCTEITLCGGIAEVAEGATTAHVYRAAADAPITDACFALKAVLEAQTSWGLPQGGPTKWNRLIG